MCAAPSPGCVPCLKGACGERQTRASLLRALSMAASTTPTSSSTRRSTASRRSTSPSTSSTLAARRSEGGTRRSRRCLWARRLPSPSGQNGPTARRLVHTALCPVRGQRSICLPGPSGGLWRRIPERRPPPLPAPGKAGIQDDNGAYVVPPNATLVFEMQLVGVRDAKLQDDSIRWK